MATEFEKLRQELLALPKDARASLAHALIASLDDEIDENVEQLWFAEIRRRDRAIKDGSAILRPANEVLREARERLRCLK
jgi:hypothetical protein